MHKYCLLLFLFLPCEYWSQQKWTQEKNVDGIRAYSRMKEGKDYYEFRTVFHVSTSLKKLSDFIFDVGNFIKWQPNCLESRVLRRESEDVIIGYTISDAPWPSTDRDVAFRVTRKYVNEKLITISIESRSDYYPVQKSYVRVYEYQAVWKLTETGPNMVEIEFIASFNPGKSTPNWVVKNGIIDARIETAKALIKALR
jgi:ribosome-associated toxin RatA of RatAB toxin-antitoxin module